MPDATADICVKNQDSGSESSSESTPITLCIQKPTPLGICASETNNIKNMTSEELGYEKVKPMLASPSKHFATSTMQKLAERLGINVDLGNGFVKPTKTSRTFICNPATSSVPQGKFLDKINKLKKKSKKKKKTLDQKNRQVDETEGTHNNRKNDGGDDKHNGGKRKRSKKKKKDKKKKKERERELDKRENKEELTVDDGTKESQTKSKKKPITSKGSATKVEEESSKSKKTKSVDRKTEKSEHKSKKNEFTKKKLFKKVGKSTQQRENSPTKKSKISKRQKQEQEEEEKRQKEREEEEADAKKRKRRSMLDELRNSDGYVAEKRFKRHENLFVDPSELGREERALQVCTYYL